MFGRLLPSQDYTGGIFLKKNNKTPSTDKVDLQENLFTTEQKLQQLKEKNKLALDGGGKEKKDKQKQGGRLTARERLNILLDPGSFKEMDRFVTHRCTYFNMQESHIPGDGVITGYGKINGQTVFVYSQDFTVFGGSMSRTQADKILKVMHLARKNEPLLLV